MNPHVRTNQFSLSEKPTRAELHTWLDMYARHTHTQHTASATRGADQRLIFFPWCSSTTRAEQNRMASLAYHLHKQSKGIRLLRGSYHVSFWGGGGVGWGSLFSITKHMLVSFGPHDRLRHLNHQVNWGRDKRRKNSREGNFFLYCAKSLAFPRWYIQL